VTDNTGMCCDDYSALKTLKTASDGVLPNSCVVVGLELSILKRAEFFSFMLTFVSFACYRSLFLS
jgi:hypothetical protein